MLAVGLLPPRLQPTSLTSNNYGPELSSAAMRSLHLRSKTASEPRNIQHVPFKDHNLAYACELYLAYASELYAGVSDVEPYG